LAHAPKVVASEKVPAKHSEQLFLPSLPGEQHALTLLASVPHPPTAEDDVGEREGDVNLVGELVGEIGLELAEGVGDPVGLALGTSASRKEAGGLSWPAGHARHAEASMFPSAL
jgi:hypothetical protein